MILIIIINVKTMFIIKEYESERQTHPTPYVPRGKYEGWGEKRRGSVRTDESRKWDDRLRREVEGNGDRGFR
jgi:hypothetical protein